MSKIDKYFESKSGFWWAILYEGLCMFSNKASFFASKRWERFIMFWIAMWVMIGYVTRNWHKMEMSEVEVIVATLLTGGIINAMMISKDQKTLKNEATNPNTVNTN